MFLADCCQLDTLPNYWALQTLLFKEAFLKESNWFSFYRTTQRTTRRHINERWPVSAFPKLFFHSCNVKHKVKKSHYLHVFVEAQKKLGEKENLKIDSWKPMFYVCKSDKDLIAEVDREYKDMPLANGSLEGLGWKEEGDIVLRGSRNCLDGRNWARDNQALEHDCVLGRWPRNQEMEVQGLFIYWLHLFISLTPPFSLVDMQNEMQCPSVIYPPKSRLSSV